MTRVRYVVTIPFGKLENAKAVVNDLPYLCHVEKQVYEVEHKETVVSREVIQ